jgi:type I site-specific restriction endonuclease
MTASSPEDEIRQEIERTRAELGQTVEALAHKADVPARVKDKVHDTKQTVQVKAEQATQQLQENIPALQAKAGEIASQAERLIHQALQKLPPPVAERIEPLITTATQQLQQSTPALQAKAGEMASQAQRLIHQALDKLPPPVAERFEPLIVTARQRPLPAAAVALAGVLVLRRLLRRKR